MMRGKARTTTCFLPLAAALAAAAWLGPAAAQQVPERPPGTELASCKAAGLAALRQKTPSITDVEIDPDGTIVAKADTRVEDTPVRVVVMGDAYLERKGSEKPYRFLCLIGDKGKVLLTFFTQQ